MYLSDDQKDTLAKVMPKMNLLFHMYSKKIDQNSLTDEEAEQFASLLESYAVDMLNGLQYDSQLERGLEERYREIREVRQENERLRKQLGNQVTTQSFIEKFNAFQNVIRDWWKREGFVFVQDVKLTTNASLSITFGFQLSRRVSMFSDNREADIIDKEKHIKSLKERGFEFVGGIDVFKNDLIDSEKNIQLLQELIKNRFPSFEVIKIEKKSNMIWSIEGTVSNLKEIENNLFST